MSEDFEFEGIHKTKTPTNQLQRKQRLVSPALR